MKIKVKNLRLRTILGVSQEEREKLQDVIVNYSIEFDADGAIKDDNIEHTFNYKNINKEIIALVQDSKYFLVESLVDAITRIIMQNHMVTKAVVEVDKPHALRFADSVSVSNVTEKSNIKTIIGLGSNINAEENIKRATEILKNRFNVIKIANPIRTPSILDKNQADFINGAVLLSTNMYMAEFKNQLKQIETQMGRPEKHNKNDPREIDLDILVWDKKVVDKNYYSWEFLQELTQQLNI